MAGKRCYYEVLGVAKTCTEREISVAYRKLAVKYHPDSNPGNEEAIVRFKEAAEAYEVLSDSQKRARYDQFGHQGVDGPAGGPHFDDVEDIFEAFGSMFGDLFGGRRGGGGGGRRVRRGADIRCDVTLDLEDAARGVTKTVEVSRRRVCQTCGGNGSRPGSQRQTCGRCRGQGQVIQSAGILRVQTTCPSCQGTGSLVTDPCEKCRGAGSIGERSSLDVAIPPGIDDGMRIRLSGEGEAGPDGGPAGDCYCFVSVKKHKLFQRDGSNLILQMPITYTQAALGAAIEVPTLGGKSSLRLEPGTQSGQVFQLRGKGMKDPRGTGAVGDLLVQTFIEVPKSLTKHQEKVLRELAELEHTEVTPHRKTFLERLAEYFSGGDEAKPSEEKA